MRTEVLTEATAPVGQVAPATRDRVRPGRRRYWVDRTSQLPTTMLAVLATAAFIVLFNLTLADLVTARREQIAASVPAVENRLRAEDRAFQRSIAILSGVFLVCVSAGMVFLTQRSSGPIRRIQTQLERLAQGDLEHPLKLRQRDHFQALGAACSALTEHLRQERRNDVAALERLAVEAEEARSAAAAAALAAKLRNRARTLAAPRASGAGR